MSVSALDFIVYLLMLFGGSAVGLSIVALAYVIAKGLDGKSDGPGRKRPLD